MHHVGIGMTDPARFDSDPDLPRSRSGLWQVNDTERTIDLADLDAAHRCHRRVSYISVLVLQVNEGPNARFTGGCALGSPTPLAADPAMDQARPRDIRTLSTRAVLMPSGAG